MAFFSSMHRWSSLLFPPIGILLNILLLYMIFRRTPLEMWAHNRILVQTGVFDCLFLAVMFVAGSPVLVSNNLQAGSYYFFRGYFIKTYESIAGVAPGLQLLCYLFYAFHYFGIYGVCVQFVYRYLCLHMNVTMKLRPYLCVLSVAIGVCLVQQLVFALLSSVLYCSTSKWHCMDYVNLDIDGTVLLQMIANGTAEVLLPLQVEKNGFSQLVQLCFVLILSGSIVSIGFCATRLVGIVNAHASLTPDLKSLNRQLNLNLLIMALLPFLLICMTLVASLIDSITKNRYLDYNYVVYMLMSSVPVLNPIVCILTNRPYRDTLFDWFLCCLINRNNQVQPQ